MHTYVPNGDAIPMGHTRPTAVSRLTGCLRQREQQVNALLICDS